MFKQKKSLDFYELLIQQAETVRETVSALCVFCTETTQENGDKVKEWENKADDVRHELVKEINDTFITPIDRDDLFRLSSSIDDIADYAWTTVKEIRIYDIEPDKQLLALTVMLRDMADGLLSCVKNLKTDLDAVMQDAVKVKKQENALNEAFHKFISELFNSDDIKKILKYREIYNHMNHASDKADMCADIILNIAIKQY